MLWAVLGRDDQDDKARLGKDQIYSVLKGILQPNNFARTAITGNISTHSLGKMTVTLCRRAGINRDDVDYRVRLKSNAQIQDRYCEMQLDWPDVSTAKGLCVGGAIVYKAKEGSGN